MEKGLVARALPTARAPPANPDEFSYSSVCTNPSPGYAVFSKKNALLEIRTFLKSQ